MDVLLRLAVLVSLGLVEGLDDVDDGELLWLDEAEDEGSADVDDGALL